MTKMITVLEISSAVILLYIENPALDAGFKKA